MVRLESALQVTREQLIVALNPQLERLVDVRLRMSGKWGDRQKLVSREHKAVHHGRAGN